jgi:MoaA/NifB/PqqE/SkfB family radical SAM enzyme
MGTRADQPFDTSGWTSFTITSKCNLKCAMCMNGFPAKYEELPPALVRRVLRDLYAFGWRGVSYTGGEPTTHTRFDELVEIAVEEKYRLGFVTNGWFYQQTLELFEKHAANIGFVTLSVDGATAATHDRIRGQKGSFRRVLEALQAYNDLGLYTRVQLVLSNQNHTEFKRYVEYFEERADEVAVLHTIGSELSHDMMLTEQQMDAIHRELRRFNRKHERVDVASSVGMERGLNFCGALGWGAVALNANGELVFCCDSLYDGAVVGDCNQESVATILPRYGQVRQRLMETRIRQIAEGQGDGYRFNSCNWCNENLRDAIKVVPQNERIYQLLKKDPNKTGVRS